MRKFVFFKESIDGSTIPDSSGIREDKFGLCAGGWFVTQSEYPESTEIISFADFKKRAVIENIDNALYYCWIEST